MASLKVDATITNVDTDGNRTQERVSTGAVTYTAISDRTFVIAADATKVIWDPTTDATEAVSDFDTLIMWADGDLDVEMTVNEGDANEELNSFRLAANTPFILGADDAYYNHSASDVLAGTLDVIDKIRVDEPISQSVTLRVILAT